jgi:hypothetical protein
MTYTFIDDPRKWRVSMTGFSIKTGWSDEKKIIARYPGEFSPLVMHEYETWLENAEKICELYNATLKPINEATEKTSTEAPGQMNKPISDPT